jgi:hypothetical protein
MEDNCDDRVKLPKNRNGCVKMNQNDREKIAERSWTVEMFKPEDALGVVDLYRAIYGENFPKQEVYRAEWHLEQARTHDTYRIVARTNEGTIIATGAIYRSSPANPELYEGGGLMALPEYGKQNVALEVAQFALKKLPLLFNIRQMWGECVCNHLFTQMYFVKDGGVACALEVDLLPDGSFKSQSERGLDLEGRVSALVIIRTYHPTRQTSYLPPIYREVLSKIYEPLPMERTFEDHQEEPVAKETSAFIDIKETAGLSRITVWQIGMDFSGWLRQVEQEAKKAGIILFQVIIPLNTPVAGKAAEYLKNEGYWLGGVMPGWFGADGLLMQKTLHEPDFSQIKVYSKPGKAILEMVKSDYLQRIK